ncbi:MAG: HupE/UreJ family protein, partial [Proteobacteria bacterium]|nr:HupE/UreJ family protein [Pseudomonadota bacterium]
ADRLGPVGPDGLPEPAPYTTNRMEEGRLVHYLDAGALRADPLGLGRLVSEGHRFTVEDAPLIAEVEQVRVYPGAEKPSFASIEDAKASFGGSFHPDRFPATYVGDIVVDTVLRYRSDGPIYDYAVSSTLDPGLEDQDQTANLLLDHFTGGTKVFRARGLLGQPIAVSRSALAAAATFVLEGIRHILEGRDRVLFVVCLGLGALSFGSLLRRATGFTIGHTVTLIAGFFGLAPSGPWFIPAVEVGIALSIIYAALVAVTKRGMATQSELTMFSITTAIGLLHGLGFSFVLHEILQVDAPNIWQSLLAFNLGVELGQVLIILATWPLFWLVARWNDRAWQIGRWGVALPIILIAALWTGQRALMVAQSLS